MRHSSRWLLSLACAVVAGSALAQDGEKSIIIGGHKLTSETIAAKIQGLGKVLEKNHDGYFRVAPIGKNTPESLVKALKGKFDVVLPGTAEYMNRSNLFSVRQHVQYKKGITKIETGKEHKGDFYQALQWYLEPRVNPVTGELDRDAYVKAAEHRDQMPAATSDLIDPFRDKTAAPAAWAFVGPRKLQIPYRRYYGNTSLSGRKNMVAPAPSNGQIGYLASAGGGIWKTTNNWVNYTQLSDNWKFLHTTCVEVHPTNPDIVLAGTGDYEGFFTRQTFGIMRSTNGGATWTNVGAADFGDSVVTRIKISHQNPNIVVALTAGPSGDIWRSTDGGVSWARTNAPDGDWQDIDWSSSDITWIAVSGTSDQVYMSLNEGASWNPRTSPAGATAGSKWDVAVSKVDFNRVYLISSNRTVYRSSDRGLTWTSITAAHDAGCSDPSYNWSQSSYDIYIDCGYSGANDVVYTGLITISASDDNGSTWNDISRSFESDSKWHNDQHNARVHPTGGSGLWQFAVGDGGVTFWIYNPATNTATFTDLNNGIADTQYYHISVHPTDSLRVIGGTQDNASPMQRGASPNSMTTWFNGQGGDGTGNGFNVASPGIHYSSSQNGNFFRYDSAGDTTGDYIGYDTGPFVTPLVMGGASRSIPTAISGSNMRKYSSGTTWTSHNTSGGSLRTLQTSKFTGNRIYTGASNGDMYQTTNFGTSFTKIDTDAAIPNRAVGGIVESFFTENWITAGFMGAGFTNGAWRRSAAGVWTNVSGAGATALPAMPINDMERDPTNLSVYYAATDVGVFVSPNEGTTWYNMNAMGLPNVHVNDLWVWSNGSTHFLYAGTFGRGIWRCLLSTRNLTSLLVAKPAIWGGQTNTFTVKMNGSAPAGSVATLSDNSTNVSIPTSVAFPIGSTQVGFTAFTSNPASTQTVTVSATAWASTVTNSFTLHRVPAFTYTAPANVYGGNSFGATINMGAPNPITATYTFTDTSTAISSPASTSIAAGSQTRLVTLNTASVVSPVNATVSCRLGSVTASSPVTVHPKPILSSLTVQPPTVVGGNPSTGTIQLNMAGNAGALIGTLSDTSTLVTVPSLWSVPNGSDSTTFNITTAAVRRTTTVTITAQMSGVSRTASITLTP